jgi:lipopolysaccharide transport system permease protein
MAPLVDCIVSLALLMALGAYYRIAPGWPLLLLPLMLLLCVAAALAVSLWLSALCVRYRDVGVVIPFLLQVWMYASPVAYPASVVPERWRFLYDLNPMSGLIDGVRWSILGTGAPDVRSLALSVVVIGVLLISGLAYFGQMEQTFADVV